MAESNRYFEHGVSSELLTVVGVGIFRIILSVLVLQMKRVKVVRRLSTNSAMG